MFWLSFIFSIICLLCGFFIMFSQLEEFYRLKTAKGLNFYSLLLWLLGDSLLLMSAVFSNTVENSAFLIVISISLERIIFDFLYTFFWYHYYILEVEILYIYELVNGLSLFKIMRAVCPVEQFVHVLVVISIIAIGIIAYIFNMKDTGDMLTNGLVIGSCGVLVLSRILQMYTNFKSKSIGLSITSLKFTIVSNIFYITAIVIGDRDAIFWYINMGIVLLFDIILFIQTFMYKRKHNNQQVENLDIYNI